MDSIECKRKNHLKTSFRVFKMMGLPLTKKLPESNFFAHGLILRRSDLKLSKQTIEMIVSCSSRITKKWRRVKSSLRKRNRAFGITLGRIGVKNQRKASTGREKTEEKQKKHRKKAYPDVSGYAFSALK